MKQSSKNKQKIKSLERQGEVLVINGERTIVLPCDNEPKIKPFVVGKKKKRGSRENYKLSKAKYYKTIGRI